MTFKKWFFLLLLLSTIANRLFAQQSIRLLFIPLTHAFHKDGSKAMLDDQLYIIL